MISLIGKKKFFFCGDSDEREWTTSFLQSSLLLTDYTFVSLVPREAVSYNFLKHFLVCGFRVLASLGLISLTFFSIFFFDFWSFFSISLSFYVAFRIRSPILKTLLFNFHPISSLLDLFWLLANFCCAPFDICARVQRCLLARVLFTLSYWWHSCCCALSCFISQQQIANCHESCGIKHTHALKKMYFNDELYERPNYANLACHQRFWWKQRTNNTTRCDFLREKKIFPQQKHGPRK